MDRNFSPGMCFICKKMLDFSVLVDGGDKRNSSKCVCVWGARRGGSFANSLDSIFPNIVEKSHRITLILFLSMACVSHQAGSFGFIE